tara:strand:+ start:718 stop:1854 length:1137 start_codon:yes stop_codon:yes gene_type:complete
MSNNRKTVKSTVPVSIRTRMERIYTYIKYCQRLEDAYRTKHEEVRTLNEYLKRIQKVLPENVSDNCPEVDDIITYINGLPDIPDTEGLNETLRRMIEEQKKWREENDRNYNLINRKIDTLNEAREVIVSESNSNSTSISSEINPIKIRGEDVIPFFLPNDKFKKHGGDFLSSYFKLKNPLSLEVTFKSGKETFKFHDVCSAYLASKAKYIEDENKRRQYISALSGKIDYEQTNRIKEKNLPEIKKNRKYALEWNKQRYEVMKKLTRQKFELNPELKNKLKQTGDAYLIEHPNNNENTFWGDSISDNKKVEGQNMMGKLLMELREEMFGIKSEFIRIKPANIKRSLNNSRNNSSKNTHRRNKMNNVRRRKEMRTRKLRK